MSTKLNQYLKKKKLLSVTLLLFGSLLTSCGDIDSAPSSDSEAFSFQIPLGASLILDADSITGASAPNGSCATTTWNDSSGSGNNGTIECATGGGFAGNGTPGDPHRIVFNGTSTSVTTALNAQANAMTDSTWVAVVRPASSAFQQILSVDNHGTTFNRSLVISGGNFGVYNPINSILAGQPINAGQWKFIAVGFSADNVFIAANGVENFVSLGAAPNYVSSANTFTIGRSAGGMFDFYSGDIAWVAVYPRLLSTDEIGNICQALSSKFEGHSCLLDSDL